MNDREIRLKELGELLAYSTSLKIIGSYDGKTLIYNYNKDKHEAFADLKISGIHMELRIFGGYNNKSMCEHVLVGWASNSEYKELKKKAQEDKVKNEISK